jgi:ribosomal protein S27E
MNKLCIEMLTKKDLVSEKEHTHVMVCPDCKKHCYFTPKQDQGYTCGSCGTILIRPVSSKRVMKHE